MDILEVFAMRVVIRYHNPVTNNCYYFHHFKETLDGPRPVGRLRPFRTDPMKLLKVYPSKAAAMPDYWVLAESGYTPSIVKFYDLRSVQFYYRYYSGSSAISRSGG